MSRPPKLLIVNRDLKGGGGMTYVKHLTHGLIGQGWDVLLHAPNGPMRSIMKGQGATLSNRAWVHAMQLPWMVRMLRNVKPDLVNSHSNTTSKAIAQACKVAGVPLIMTVHGHVDEETFLRLRPSTVVATAVVALNDCIALSYNQKGVPWEKLFVSRLFVPWAPEAPTKPAATTLAYCSRLSSAKGLAAEAFLKGAIPLRFPITVIGDGSMRRQLEPLGGTFVGSTPKVREYLSQAHVAAGAGYVAIESIEAGCIPVGMGFDGCIGAVSAENFAYVSARNYGDQTFRALSFDPEYVREETLKAIELYQTGEATKLREIAEQSHSAARIIPIIDQFYRRVSAGESFGDLSLDATGFEV